jgi:hypothetical protein
MTVTVPPVPDAAVHPLWRRHDLFLEPAYSGIEPYEDGDDDLEDEA